MADKELRKLSRRELLQMLVAQCEETEKLQQEADQLNARLEELEESYERLKIKLNIKDEKLNQKDAQIAELSDTIEEMRETREIELTEAGSIAEAALRLNGIFEAAQEAADQYLSNVIRLVESGQAAPGKIRIPAASDPSGRPETMEALRLETTKTLRPETTKKIKPEATKTIMPAAPAGVMPVYAGERKKVPGFRRVTATRKKLLHG